MGNLLWVHLWILLNVVRSADSAEILDTFYWRRANRFSDAPLSKQRRRDGVVPSAFETPDRYHRGRSKLCLKNRKSEWCFFQITVSKCFWLYLNPVCLIKYCFTFNKSSIVKWYQSIPKHVTWFLASCLPVAARCVRISLRFFC